MIKPLRDKLHSIVQNKIINKIFLIIRIILLVIICLFSVMLWPILWSEPSITPHEKILQYSLEQRAPIKKVLKIETTTDDNFNKYFVRQHELHYKVTLEMRNGDVLYYRDVNWHFLLNSDTELVYKYSQHLHEEE